MKTVILYSGGLDSTTLLFDLCRNGEDVTAVWVDYSQKSAEKERRAVNYFANICGCDLVSLDMKDIFKQSESTLIKGNGHITVMHQSGGHIQYIHRRTEVECRNVVLISAALAIATQICLDDCAIVYYGAIQTREYLPDCSSRFVRLMDETAKLCSYGKVSVKAPYIDKGKNWVMRRAKELGIDTDRAWSCYEGGPNPCGVCPACVDRRLVEDL